MPILPLDIENFNGRKLLFLLTLQEYHESGYLAFYIDEENDLWFQGEEGFLPFDQLEPIPVIALYESMPDNVKESDQYIHTPMVYVVEDYLKLVFGKKLRFKD
ncbi:hypothetical protein E7Z59_09845 [Robertkochia marina]|uniref:Uncharacterized protein n=1 Tax=Robertkochia marina TaxID=1227945 RepID=A0A4S3M0I4_9FLAO|nr:hypothetical protein [Robertkochia marina]THD67942.1 hypothetical protein E7Z59_09845 [Robertkochia marina]TRZ41046.1 hypothetical protein D3A96_14390 [Robertkochia marina]